MTAVENSQPHLIIPLLPHEKPNRRLPTLHATQVAIAVLRKGSRTRKYLLRMTQNASSERMADRVVTALEVIGVIECVGRANPAVTKSAGKPAYFYALKTDDRAKALIEAIMEGFDSDN